MSHFSQACTGVGHPQTGKRGIWGAFMECQFAAMPYLGILTGGLNAAKTLCENRSQIDALNTQLDNINAIIANAKRNERKMEEKYKQFMNDIYYQITTVDREYERVQQRYNKNKTAITVYIVAILCLMTFLLVAKRLNFFTAESILSIFKPI